MNMDETPDSVTFLPLTELNQEDSSHEYKKNITTIYSNTIWIISVY